MEQLNCDVDYKDYEKSLSQFGKKAKTVAKRLMGGVASAIRKDSRKIINKVEGALGRSIKYKTKADFSATITAGANYASFIELGGTIEAREKYMAFQVQGEWRKAKSVTFKARPFLRPTIDDYFSGSKAEDIMDEILQDALDKLFEDNK